MLWYKREQCLQVLTGTLRNISFGWKRAGLEVKLIVELMKAAFGLKRVKECFGRFLIDIRYRVVLLSGKSDRTGF